MRLNGKIAIVTGAGSGIGRASALLFAREGASVVACDIDEERGEETVDAVRKEGGDAFFVQADVADSGQVQAMVRACLDRYAGLDVLFNCAAVSLTTRDGAVGNLDEEIWNTTIAINLTGTFLCCKHAVPIMAENRRGSIINVDLAGLPRLVTAPRVLGEQGGGPLAHQEHRRLVRAAQRPRKRDLARGDRHPDEPSHPEHPGDGGGLLERPAPLSAGAADRSGPPRPVPRIGRIAPRDRHRHPHRRGRLRGLTRHPDQWPGKDEWMV